MTWPAKQEAGTFGIAAFRASDRLTNVGMVHAPSGKHFKPPSGFYFVVEVFPHRVTNVKRYLLDAPTFCGLNFGT